MSPIITPKEHMQSIVIAEDDFATRHILIRIFEQSGFVVTAVEDGQQACSTIRSVLPDIALLDLYLPKQDGREVLQTLRADELTEGIPVVVLTTISRPQVLKDVISMGAQAVVCKPFDLGDLVEKIQTQIAHQP